MFCLLYTVPVELNIYFFGRYTGPWGEGHFGEAKKCKSSSQRSSFAGREDRKRGLSLEARQEASRLIAKRPAKLVVDRKRPRLARLFSDTQVGTSVGTCTFSSDPKFLLPILDPDPTQSYVALKKEKKFVLVKIIPFIR